VRPWRDGTTHLVMTPLEFMHRLAAQAPRPRLHLIRRVPAQLRIAKWAAPVARTTPQIQIQRSPGWNAP
jgi:hypothetical protein